MSIHILKNTRKCINLNDERCRNRKKIYLSKNMRISNYDHQGFSPSYCNIKPKNYDPKYKGEKSQRLKYYFPNVKNDLWSKELRLWYLKRNIQTQTRSLPLRVADKSKLVFLVHHNILRLRSHTRDNYYTALLALNTFKRLVWDTFLTEIFSKIPFILIFDMKNKEN